MRTSVKADGVDARDVFWLVFKVWVADWLRRRNPSGYAISVLGSLILEDDELLPQLDPAPVTRLLKGEATEDDADAFVDRISAASGALVVLLDRMVAPVGGTIDAMYGWDPEPGSDRDASVAASRALSVVFKVGDAIDPILTIIPVTKANGGPGLLISAGARLKFEHDTGSIVYTTDIGANGAFSLFFRFSRSNPNFRAFGPGAPSIDIGVSPKADEDDPFLVFGTSNADAARDRLLLVRHRARRGPRRLQVLPAQGQARHRPRRRRRLPLEAARAARSRCRSSSA